MHIILVGGAGTIGKAVYEELSQRHQVTVAGRSSGDVLVNLTDTQSIVRLFETIKNVDAVVCTAGNVHFAALDEMTAEDYAIGLNDKLMGQVNLVSIGMRYLNDGGSFTLTSGILNHDPIRYGISAAMVNGALDGFVKSAALELPRGMRINGVSPTVVAESMGAYAEYFRGFVPVPVCEVALAYSKSVEGLQTGQVYRAGY